MFSIFASNTTQTLQPVTESAVSSVWADFDIIFLSVLGLVALGTLGVAGYNALADVCHRVSDESDIENQRHDEDSDKVSFRSN